MKKIVILSLSLVLALGASGSMNAMMPSMMSSMQKTHIDLDTKIENIKQAIIEKSSKNSKHTKLVTAITLNNNPEVTRILAKGLKSKNFKSKNIVVENVPLLFIAIKHNNYGIVETLLNAGFSIERSYIANGITIHALDYAILEGHPDIVRLLLDNGALIDTQTTALAKESPNYLIKGLILKTVHDGPPNYPVPPIPHGVKPYRVGPKPLPATPTTTTTITQ